MDGDNRRMKQYERSSYLTRARMGRHSVLGRSGGTTDHFRQPALLSSRGDVTGLSQSRGNPRMSNYADYGYTGQQSYTGNSFQSGSLQGDELQQPSYHSDFSRQHHQTLREHQRVQEQQQQQQQNHQQHQHQQPQQFASYEPEMVYNLNQQGQAQETYGVVPQYQTRQSAAIEALSTQFAVPQYFPPAEPTGTGVHAVVSPYLTTPQVQSSAAYNHTSPIGRSSAGQPFPTTMAEFTPVGTTGRLEQQPPPQQPQPQPSSEPTSVEEAYGQFQHALRETFDRTRAGRLPDAGRSLLEISDWLVTNARELGILRDDQLLYSDRLQLWNNFNICWLAVCQKQKDMTQDLLQMGHQSPNTSLLSSDMMENMGKELIQLCDQMEQYGLVDYQMGIWEEEILCVLSQCLDLMDSRPDILRPNTIPREPATAVATSRT